MALLRSRIVTVVLISQSLPCSFPLGKVMDLPKSRDKETLQCIVLKLPQCL